MSGSTYDFSAFQDSSTYDFSAFSAGAAGGQSGMSFIGGSMGSGGASAGGAPGEAASGGAASAAGGGNLTSQLSQSPFGALLNLPGVTAANLFSNVNPADYGGGNPFAALGSNANSGAYGGNPFANLGTNAGSAYPSSAVANPFASAGNQSGL
jgi:hypothetical protein